VRSGNYGIRFSSTPSTKLYTNLVAWSGNSEVYASSSSVFGSATWENNLVWGANDHYLGVSDPTGSNGNLYVDPLFTDVDADDFTLTWGSKAIDLGQDLGALGLDTDIHRDSRLQGTGYDIGAYEFEGPTDDCDGTDDGDHSATACPVYVDADEAPGGNGDEATPYASIDYAMAYRGDLSSTAVPRCSTPTC